MTIRERVNQRLDVQRILTELKIKFSNGNDEFKICCPFHEEKTPSCFLSDSKKVFNCFGCGAKGDLVYFLARIKKISIDHVILQYSADLKLTSYLNGIQFEPLIDEYMSSQEWAKKCLHFILDTAYWLRDYYFKIACKDNPLTEEMKRYYYYDSFISQVEDDILKLQYEIFRDKNEKPTI